MAGKIVSTIRQHLTTVPSWAKECWNDTDNIKVLIRCVIAAWAGFLLILPTNSLKVLGNAGFFAAISLAMLPPSFPAQTYFLATSTLLVGIMTGWAWSCAAMAAAISVRSQTLLASAYEQENSSIAGQSNPDQLFQRDLFHGIFLDPSSSAVFGAFLFIGTFFFAFVKSKAPKLAFFSIFGTVIVDVFTSYGPLFPSAQYLFLQTFVISAACGVAIGLAASLLIFPRTANYVWLKTYVGAFEPLKQLLDAQSKVLREQSDADSKEENEVDMDGLTTKVASTISGAEGMNAMLELEVSYGKLSPSHLKELIEPTKKALFYASCLKAVGKSVTKAAKPFASQSMPNQESWMTVYATQVEDGSNGPGRKDLLPLLSESSAPLFESCSNALGNVETLLQEINRNRWSYRKTNSEALSNLSNTLSNLRKTRELFLNEDRLRVFEPYREIFGPDGKVTLDHHKLPPFPVQTLFMVMAFCDNVLFLSDAIIELAHQVYTLCDKHQKARLWFPTTIRHLGKYLTSGSGKKEDEKPTEESSEKSNKDKHVDRFVAGIDPEANFTSGKTSDDHKFARKLYHLYAWTKTPEALYCLKYSVISILFWLPSVFRSTAFFNYSNKILWAQIMAQTGLDVYSSNQIAAYIPRLIGTLVGLVLGMLVWYIGNANGNGSPYGTAAIVFVALIPLMMLRLHSKDMIMAIMISVTVVLIFGYSWIDTHLPTLANPGKGYEIAWKRWLLVVVGMFGALVFMLIPPSSGRRHTREEHSRTIQSLSDLFTNLIEDWFTLRELEEKKQDKEGMQAVRDEVLAIASRIAAIKQTSPALKFEIDLKGKWPAKEYNELLDIESSLLNSLAFLAIALRHSDLKMQQHAIRNIGLFDQNTVADVHAVLTILHQSMRNATAVPASIPRHLFERMLYHRERLAADKGVLEGNTLTFDQLQNVRILTTATTIVAAFRLLADIDDLQKIMRKLMGEVKMPAFAKESLGRNKREG